MCAGYGPQSLWWCTITPQIESPGPSVAEEPKADLQLGQTMVEVMMMATSFKRSHARTAAHSAPNLAAGHRQPTPPPETPEHSWASLGQSLVGSLLLSLGPGVHKVLFLPSKSLFTQSCVSSDGSLVGLMATSSKRAYAIPRSPAPRTLPLQQSTVDPYLHRRDSNTVLAQSLWGLCVLVGTRFV